MSKLHKKVTLLINKDGRHQKICKLIPSRKDASIFLHIYKHREIHPDGIKKLTFYADSANEPITGIVNYGSGDVTFNPIAHQTVHSTGESHLKLEDHTYEGRQIGIPLADLAVPRALWTIVPGRLSNAVTTEELKGRIVGIKESPEIAAWAINIFALPKGGNLNFQVNFDLVSDLGVDELPGRAKVPPDIYLERVGFEYFDVALFYYSTSRFHFPPPVTHAFPTFGNLTPFVRRMDENSMELVLRVLM